MANETVYKPVWYCIYCSDGIVKQATKRKLGKEHIIPHGLGGVAILPRSSCKKCEAITGKVETMCQHMMFGPVRIRLGLQTRNPDDRPTKLTLGFLHRNGRLESRTIPASDYPLAIPGLKLPPPGILTGSEPHDRQVGEIFIRLPTDDHKRWLAEDGPAVRLASFNNHVFCQMLAKIAHSYAVAEWGFHSFEPLLLDLILGRSETASYWVGGDMTVSAPEPAGLHRLQLKREIISNIEYVIAYITLFCNLGMPEYRIVVGIWNGIAD
ncbi:MAG: hypothetical protein ACLQIQ_09280 [Beijerinckiaceae bacterium]